MENQIQIKPIGKVRIENGVFSIQIDKEFLPALTNIEGFSHLQVVWWGHLFDGEQYRTHLVSEKPYKKGPGKIGVFATRSPVRPNPILITTIDVIRIDYEKGILYTSYIDAENDSIILDIKPYQICERVKNCTVPQWCEHWPKWHEESETFDWESEFNF